MPEESHQRPWPGRWWDAGAGFGAAFVVIGVGNEVLALAGRARLLPAAGVTTMPLYVAGGVAGAIVAMSGRDALAIVLLVAFFVVERSIRFASQLQIFVMTHDPSALELVVPQVLGLLIGAAAAAVVLRGLGVRVSGQRGALLGAGACLGAGTLALLPLRASALGLVALDGGLGSVVIAFLAMLLPAGVGLGVGRREGSVRASLVGASILVLVATGATIATDLSSRPFDNFALAQLAPLIALLVLVIVTLGKRGRLGSKVRENPAVPR